jgi:hypothetical protein
VDPAWNWFKIDAGLLDDDPEIRPDRHIFTELMAPWFEITGQNLVETKLTLSLSCAVRCGARCEHGRRPRTDVA